MKTRSPGATFFLPLVTFGIYSIVWFVKTKDEMNELIGEKIPTAWLTIVPIAVWWWQWRFAIGVEQVTNGKVSKTSAFLLTFFLGSLGMAIVQSGINAAVVAVAVPTTNTPVQV